MKLVQERTAFKVLLERNGLLLSFTTRNRAFFLFLSGKFVGMKVAPTTDPDLGIVELSGYDISTILDNWDRLSRAKVERRRRVADPI